MGLEEEVSRGCSRRERTRRDDATTLLPWTAIHKQKNGKQRVSITQYGLATDYG